MFRGHTIAVRQALVLDEKATVLAFRGVIFLVLVALLLHSPFQENSFASMPFALAAFYLMTSVVAWLSRDPRLNSPDGQASLFLWDVAVITCLLYNSEGFDEEVYLMYFLILFMSALLTEVWQSFLIGAVSCLLYAWLWSKGRAAGELPMTNLLLRFAFFYAAAFFTAMLAHRVRTKEKRYKNLELRLSLERIANGGWGLPVEEALEPDVAKTVRTVNSLIDNMARALERVLKQNEELRETAATVLMQMARERERLGAVAESKQKAPTE